MRIIAPMAPLVYTAAMRRFPISFIALTGLGVVTAIPGLASVAGYGASLHPVLADPMAGLALLVSAVALVGSGLFPFFIARLMNQGAKDGS